MLLLAVRFLLLEGHHAVLTKALVHHCKAAVTVYGCTARRAHDQRSSKLSVAHLASLHLNTSHRQTRVTCWAHNPRLGQPTACATASVSHYRDVSWVLQWFKGPCPTVGPLVPKRCHSRIFGRHGGPIAGGMMGKLRVLGLALVFGPPPLAVPVHKVTPQALEPRWLQGENACRCMLGMHRTHLYGCTWHTSSTAHHSLSQMQHSGTV